MTWVRGRKALASGVAIAVLAGVPITLAIVHQGFPVTDVDLTAQNVWVTNGQQLLGGRLNHQISELDAKVNGTSSHLDVLQDGGATILADTSQGSVQVIDPAFVSLTQKITVPVGSQLAYGQNTLAILGQDGRLWVIDTTDRLVFDAAKTAPAAKLGAGSQVTVSKTGQVFAVSQTQKKLFTVAHPGAVASSTSFPTPKNYQLSAVGENPLVLDTTANKLIRANGQATALPGKPIRIQQAGPDNGYAVVATGDSLLEVPVGGGTVTTISAKIQTPVTGVKNVSAPVFLNGCAYGAWSGAQKYLYACDGKTPVAQDIGQPTTGADLEFRVNHGVIALNNLQNGNAWVASSNIRLVNNWSQVNPNEVQSTSDNGQEKPVQQSFADQLANRTDVNHAPVATDDTFGARPGRTTVLPVLDNDTDQDGDVLTITAVDGLSASQGTVDVIEGGRALQYTPPSTDISTASFRYTITDGRQAYASASVNVTVRQPNENVAPVAKRSSSTAVEVGQSISYNVLNDWIDPDGDNIYLLSAASTTPDLVQFQPDGTITFTSKTGQAGSKSVSFTISDGKTTATGTLDVTVNPADSMDPIATPDFATTVTNSPVVLHPLANDQSPSGATLQLVGAKSEYGGPVQVSVDTDNSTISVASGTAGQYYLLYTVVAGSHTTQGLALVNVADPVNGHPAPIAVNDVAYVRPGEPTSVNVLDNDISPSGNVLVLQSVTQGATASALNVEVLDKSIVRVTTPGVLNQQVQLSYTVSDGAKTATAGITVVPIPPLVNHQAPVAVDDPVTVRQGDIASVPVLDNDYSPDNEPFTLDSELVDATGGGTGSTSFVSGSLVRYQAPTTPGNYTLTYGITDKFGQKAQGTISITVTPKSLKNTAPVPQDLNARAFAGLTSVIVVPLDGIDPEGDSVSFSGITVAPTLGRIIATTPTSFTYEAYANSTGTDHFQYQVVDALGKIGTGNVNVGVAPPPATSKPPTAVDDKIEIKPGKTAAVPVLLNDSDPNGYTISLEKKLLSIEAPLTAKVSGGTVLVTAPPTEGTYSIQYRITNGQGGQATAYIQVVVTKDATPIYPTAEDHIITIDQLTGKSSIAVNVLDGALNPSGLATDLKIGVKGTNAGAAAIGTGGKVTVTPGEHRMAIAYTLTDATTGLAGEAFIIVPPKPGSADASTAPPHIKAGIDTVIKMNGSATYDLSKIIDVPSGRAAKIVDPASVKATNSDGKSPYVGAQQLQFTGAKDYRGPAAITFKVDDGKDPGTTEDRVTLLTLPLTVGSADQSDVPPTFTPPNEQIEAGEAATTIDLRDSTYQPNPQILSQVTYSDFSTSNPDIKYTTSGSKISISSDFGVQPGTAGVISFTVTSGDFHIQGSVNVKVVSSSKPTAYQKSPPQKSAVQRGNGSQITLSDAVGDAAWYNPFAAQGQTLKISAATIAAGPSGSSVSFTGSTLTLSAPTGAQTGTVTVNYTVQDATKDPARNQTGQWQIQIHDVPGTGSTPTATNPTNTKANVAITAPADNGDLVIDQYEIVSSPAAVDVTETAVGTFTVSGLTNGTSYTFKVRAHNSDGWGPYSGASNAVTPYGTPSAPQSLSGSGGESPATVSYSWAAPADTGGGSVTYHYIYNGGSEKTTTGTSVGFGGQGVGTYTLELWAVNDGSGSASGHVSDSESVTSTPSVTISKGVQAGCSPNCHKFNISLSNFPGGGHTVKFYCQGSYDSGYDESFSGNSYTSNFYCGWNGSFVLVDGVQSNTVDMR